MTNYRACTATILLLFSAPALLHSQVSAPALLHSQGIRSTDRGPSVGLAYTGVGIATTEDGATTTESGNGVVAEVGYGFGKLWLGGQFNSASMNDIDGRGTYTLSGLGLTGRYVFRGTDKMARPYLEVGGLRRQLTADVVERGSTTTVKASSFGASFGGGISVFFTPRFALDVGGQYGFGDLTDWKANGVAARTNDLAATTFVLRLGGRWFLSGE